MTLPFIRRHRAHTGLPLFCCLLWLSASLAYAQSGPAIDEVCYVSSDDNDRLTLLDPRTGEELDLGPILGTNGNSVTDIEAITIDPDLGTLYAANGGQLGTLDRATSVFTALGPSFQVGFGSVGFVNFDDLDALAYDPTNDVIWACERRGSADVILQLDPSTGLYRDNALGGNDYAVLSAGDAGDCDDLAIRPGSFELWGLFSDGNSKDRIGRIDKSTFAVTLAANLVSASNPALDDAEGLAFARNGRLYATTGADNQFLEIDPSTGIGTLISTLDFGDNEGLACFTRTATCGDGSLADIEQCDDGNAIADDGCTACVIDATALYCSDASDGDLTVSASTILNTYHPGLGSAPAGSTTLSVGASRGASTAIAPGDLLLVIQMQGAEIDPGASANAGESYGDGPAYNDRAGHLSTAAFTAGLYERVRATTAVVSGTLGIAADGPNGGLVHSYVSSSAVSASLGVRSFQVIRIPEPASLRLQSSLTASPWDGASGGVASVSVQGTLTFASGGIDVTALGFRGGMGATSNNNVQGQAGSPGERGEGIAGRPRKTFATSGRTFLDYGTSGYPSSTEGVGAPDNGGGPATRSIDAGAGGGGNGGSGGRGGAGTGQNISRSGLGGAPVSGPQHVFPTRHRLTLGGGGGGASGDDALPGDGSSSSGQSGGGIILLWADNVAGSAGYLKANGATAITDAGEGGGGGGAGGSIFVSTRRRELPADTVIEAKGGPGVGMTLDSDGSGGGGGGGLVFFHRTSASSSDVSGGAAGTAVSGGAYVGRAGTAGMARPSVPPSVGANCTFSLAPKALADSAGTNEDTPVQIEVLLNDSDPDGDLLTITLETAPSFGQATVGGSALTYTPAPNKHGTDAFKYRICDPSGLCASATVSVDVRPINDSPVAGDDAFTVAEDSAATSFDVLSNDTDPDNEVTPIAVTAVTQPSRGGRVSLDTGRVVFTPSADFSGTVTFEYTVSDASGATDSGLVTVTVTSANDAPNAIDDAFTLVEDATATNIAVLSNDIDLDSPVLTLTAVTQPATGGSVTIDNNSVKFTPSPNFNGTVTFTYTISDGSLTDTATVTGTITAVNDPPTARTDFVTIEEDTASVISVLANDSDPEGLPLSVFSVSVSQNGIAKLESGVVTFTPNANFYGSTFFTYQIRDSGNLGAGATVLITVKPSPDAPIANADNFTVAEDSSATFLPVLLNDTDPDGETPKLLSVEQPDEGTVVLADNTLTFVPRADFNGTTSFTYTIADPTGRIASGTATVVITPTNDAPVAIDDTAAVPTGGRVTLDVVSNDTDSDGDTLRVSTVSESDAGTITFHGGTVTFNANPGATGEARFTYKVTDGNLTDEAEVTIVILDFGLFDDRYSVRNDTTLDVAAPGVFENDILPGGSASASLLGPPNHGTLQLESDGAFTFDPDDDFTGETQFTYGVTVDGKSATAVVTIEIRARPRGENDTLILDEDTDAELDLTANDTFDAIDSLDVGSAPEHGEVTLSPDGFARYSPEPEFSGDDRFTYRLCDGPTCFESEVLVSVREVADPPVANDDLATLTEETLIDVLVNDRDPEGGALTLSSFTPPSSGSATIVDNQLLYTPAVDFEGLVTISYEVCDETSLCSTASVEVTVVIVRLPVAVDDALVTETETPVTFNPLENDLDPNAPTGSVLSVLAVGNPTHGSAILQPDGQVTYSPEADFEGIDTFIITITDTAGATDESLTTVTVNPRPNRSPLASDDAITLFEDAPPTPIAALDNDTDPDEDSLALSAIELDSVGGTAEIDGTFIVFSPATDFNGQAVIRYSIDDGRGGTSSADILVTVEPVNDRPIAVPDAFVIDEDSPSLTLAVLDNDTDIENDDLEILDVTGPDEGATVTLENGEIVVLLDANYSGELVFSYTVGDSSLSDATEVSLEIRPVPDAPIARADRALALAGGASIEVAVLENDTDPDGDSLSLDNVTSSNGGLTAIENGKILFTPAADFEGEATFEYTISDPSGLTATAIVTVVVSSLFAESDLYQVRSDDTLDVPAPGVLANDLAPSNATVALVEPVSLDAGTLVLAPDGGFRFEPAADFRGETTFTYRLSSGDSISEATLTISVTPAPEAGDDLVETSEDTPILLAVLENELASPSAALAAGTPTHGTATVRPDGILYTPEPDFAGVDTFEYERCENDHCHIARVSVEVSPADDPPRPVDDDAVTPGGVPVELDVLANDWHPEGRSFSITDVEPPEHGDLDFTETTLTYSPDLGYAGLDRARYTVCDDLGLCAEAHLSIIVGQGNRRPIGRPDFYDIEAGDQLDLRVLLNDADPERSPLTLTDVSGARHGETLRIGSVISYSADAGFDGLDRFTYTVCDADDACAVVDVVVTVEPDGNRPPTAFDDDVVTSDTLRFDPTSNDLDPDGDALTLFSVGEAAHGRVSLENGEVVYSPDIGFSGQDAFEVTISDRDSLASTSVVLVHVVAEIPAAPLPRDDQLSASGLEPTLLDVLENDTENDVENLRIYAVTQPAHGFVAISEDGLEYEPESGFSGEVTLRYTVIDALGRTATATALVTLGDHDGDGLPDSVEVTLGTDPDKADTDGDGLLDGVEVATGNPQAVDPTDTDPLDVDSDDDALADGDESKLGVNPRLADTDGDGLPDGLELGRTEAVVTTEDGLAGTDPERFRPDLDPETTTDPLDADSDDDGLVDGDEDTNINGRWDGLLGDTGTDGLGESDPTVPDTDADGLQDGTERGVSTPSVDTDLDLFLPDLDPSTTTDPLDPDTDDGGASDGDEDANFNGRVDGGERNPVDDPEDDTLKAGRSSGCSQGPVGLGLLPLVILFLRRRALRPWMKM